MVLAQQAIPASKDARNSPPMAPDADIPFVPCADKSTIELPCALCVSRTAATIAAGAIERQALDDVMLAGLECQPDNAAIAVIVEHLVIPVELNPTGIVVTARPRRGRGSSWE